MTKDVEYILLNGRLYEIGPELRFTEANSPQGESNAAACLPAGCGRGGDEPAAFARRETLAKVETFMEKRLDYVWRHSFDTWYKESVARELRMILQHITRLIGTEGQDAP